jgi:hypothetical protein
MVESMTQESGPIWCVPAVACWWSRQTFFCVFSDSRASLVHVGIQFIRAHPLQPCPHTVLKGEVICWARHLMLLLCIKPLQKMWENIL